MVNIEKSRARVRKRNREILLSSQQGESPRRLAERFQISRSRVDAILEEFKTAEAVASSSRRSLATLRAENDPDRPWPVSDLISAIGPLAVTQTSLRNHFDRQQIKQLTLRSLIEMTIPLKSIPEDGGGVTSDLLRIFGVGKKGFWSVVNRLTKLDLGPRFNEEWRSRLPVLRRRWGIKGELPYG